MRLLDDSYVTNVIVLHSVENPGMEIYIIPTDIRKVVSIQEVANEAYQKWFACDNEEDPFIEQEAVGDTVVRYLEDSGYREDIDYIMFFGNGFTEGD